MTAEESIKHLKLIVDNEAYSDYFQDVCRTAIEALEKQIKKKPINIYDYYIDETYDYDFSCGYCPNCKKGFHFDEYDRPSHCECGQAFDWSEVFEE